MFDGETQGTFKMKNPLNDEASDEASSSSQSLPDANLDGASPGGFEPAQRALFLFDPTFAPRRAILQLVLAPQFDTLILGFILFNGVLLAIDDPLTPLSQRSEWENSAEMFCNILFTIECSLKIFALGFVIGKGTYLRSGWNMLDFVIVVSAWLPYLVDGAESTTALRTLRIMRPLRTINRFPKLKQLVITIFMSAPQLNLLFLCVFMFFYTYGVVAVQMWTGTLQQRCQDAGSLPCQPPDYSTDFYNQTCADSCSISLQGCGGKFCDVLDDTSCPASWCGLVNRNPYFDFASFDIIFEAWVVILQCVTTSSWQEIMHKAWATTGAVAVFYFLSCVMLGAYFLMNLYVAVLKQKFNISVSVMAVGEAAFVEIDVDGSGMLDEEELSEIFAKKGLSLTPKEVEGVMEEMHGGHDEEVSLPQFLAWLCTDSILAAKLRNRMELLERLKSGTDAEYASSLDSGDNLDQISAEDRARRTLRMISTVKGAEDWERLFYFYDRDKSGDLDFREFKQIIRRDAGITMRMMSEEELTDVFKNVDDDDSGAIELDEFVTWLGKKDVATSEPVEEQEDIVRELDDQQEDETASYPAWRVSLLAVVDNSLFNNFFIVMILINTVVLAMDHHGINDDTARQLEQINTVLTYLFGFEVALKIVALQKSFGVEAFNYFDLFVVLAGFTELLLQTLGNTDGNNSASVFRVFRVFRVLRVLRIISFFKPLRAVLRCVVKTMTGVFYIVCLLGLFMFMFAIVGMQVFGGKMEFPASTVCIHDKSWLALECGTKPRWHFDNFPVAFTTTFSIITYDLWNYIMYDGMRAVGSAGSVYFIIWIVLGALILRNLLLVIILESYVIVTDQIRAEDARAAEQLERAQLKIEAGGATPPSPDSSPALANTIVPFDAEQQNLPEQTRSKSLLDLKEGRSAVSALTVFDADSEDKALGLFAKNHNVRQMAIRLAESMNLDDAVMVCIFLSCIAISFETPAMDPDSDEAKFLWVCGLVFTLVFTLECVIKVVAWGPSTYLDSGWNRLDFSVLLIAWVDLTMAHLNLSSLKAMRALRAVRLFNKIKGLRILVVALLDAVVSLLNVVGLTFIMWLVFAIYAVTLLKGRFWYCNDRSGMVEGIVTCVGNYVDEEGMITSRIWANPPANFDHIGNAMYSLFEVSLGEWSLIAHTAMDSAAVDKQPIRENSLIWCLYFLAFVILSNLFFLNLFVGVIYESYNARKYEGIEELTKEQREWLMIQENLASRTVKPSRQITHNVEQGTTSPNRTSSNGTEHWTIKFATHPKFDVFILYVIVFNCVVMGMKYHGEPEWYLTLQMALNNIMTLIFTAEAAIRISAFGWNDYWADKCFRFDFIVVIGSWVDILATLVDASAFNTTIFRIIRITRVIGRVGRLFEVLRFLQGIDVIIDTFIGALPNLFYIASFIGLEIFTFAVVGMNIFGKVIFTGCMNEWRNFRTVPMAMLTLFGVVTKDGGACIVHASMVQPPLCSNELGNCGDPMSAKIFFIVFDLVLMITTVEMFVNIILAKYEEVAHLKSLPVTSNDIKDFVSTWKKYDSKASGWISHEQLQLLIDELPRSLGYDELAGEDLLHLSELRLPDLPNGEFGGFAASRKAAFPQMGHSADFEQKTSNEEFDNAVLNTTDSSVGDDCDESQEQERQDGHISPSSSTCDLEGDYNFYEILYGLCERKAGQPVS